MLNSHLVQTYVAMDKRVQDLLLLIKVWMDERCHVCVVVDSSQW